MKPLRILSYNVRYFGHGTRGLASTAAAMRRIAHAIAELDPLPAIVCLQEVETRSFRSTVAHRGRRDDTQLERFVTMLSAALSETEKPERYEAYYFPAHCYRLSPRARVYTTGLAILARSDFVVERHNAGLPHDITHRRAHPISKLKQTRICAHARIRIRSGGDFEPIDVFNTHLSLPNPLSKTFWTEPRRLGWGKNQLEEARNLIDFVERERRTDRFVVVGDFNALPDSPVYKHVVETTPWIDAFARMRVLTREGLVGWPTAGFLHLRMHLDHVFTGPGLAWTDFDETHPYGERSARFHGLSDHVPMIGRFI